MHKPRTLLEIADAPLIRLRPMDDGDVATIKGWPSYPPDFADLDYALRQDGWLTEFHSKPNNCCEVAMLGDELIGFALLLKTHADETEAEYRIALRADQLGSGHGRAITRLVLTRAFAEMGLSRIRLVVRKTNSRARRLYEKLGFRPFGQCVLEVQGKPVAFIEMDIGPEAGRHESPASEDSSLLPVS